MFQRVEHLSTVFICRYSKLLLNYNNLFAHTCKMAEKNHWDIWTKLASQNRMCKKTLSKWTYCLFTSPQEPCVLSISLAWQVKWNASFLVSVIYFLQFPLKYFVLRLQDHFFLQTCVIVISPDLSTSYMTWLVLWGLLWQNNCWWFIYFYI